jgi:hypothetical protein
VEAVAGGRGEGEDMGVGVDLAGVGQEGGDVEVEVGE